MIKNRWIYLFTMFLAIIAIALIVKNSKSTIRGEFKNFAISDTANVTKIFLSDKNNRNVLLERQREGYWRLNGLNKAQEESVDLLLKTMLNLAVMEPVPQSSHNIVVKLLATSSVKVEIYQMVYRINLFNKLRLFRHEKRTRTYYVGHVTQNNIGTYMLMDKSSTPFIVYLPGFRGFVQSRYSTLEKDWRDHGIFSTRLQDIESVTVEFAEYPNLSYKVVNRDGLHYSLISLGEGKDVVNFDTMKVVNFLVSFANIRFEAMVDEINPLRRDSIISRLPLHIITLADKSGKQVVVRTFHKPALPGATDFKGNPLLYDIDRFFALINDGKDFVLIQFFVFDKITRPITYFLRNP
jgi:hypothetical protein